MDGGGEFHNAKAGAEMSAGDRDGIDGLHAQLVGDLLDLFHLESAQIVGGADGVEKRGFTEYGHGDIPVLHVGTSSPT
jgi:hypothetical protein